MRTECTVMRKRKGKNRSTGKNECIGNDGQEIQTPWCNSSMTHGYNVQIDPSMFKTLNGFGNRPKRKMELK